MPIPKPKDGEDQDAFISRCMADEVMKSDYDDNDQRLAICSQSWESKDQKSVEADELRSIIERRYVPALELREDAEKKQIAGYAAVFNSWSEDLGFFKEQIAPGAFQRTIKNGDIRALINHDPNLIIGRTKNDTLRLWEDDKGLGFEVDLPDTSYAKDLRESIKRKDITQNSFGFITEKDEWSEDGKRRTLHEVRLFDISPVTFPAYKQTSVKLRLHDLGIDYDVLAVALIRSSRGVATDNDADALRSAIDILSKCLPKPVDPLAVAPEGPEHSTETADPDLVSTLLRMRMASMSIRQILSRR